MSIAFVAAADLGNNGGTTNSLTASHTIGGGANRLLAVCVEGDVVSGNTAVPTVTYNGVSMTLAVQNNGVSGLRIVYLFYLLEASLPAAGTYNVVTTFSPSQFIIVVAGYYTGVGALNNTATNFGAAVTSLTTSITTAANAWAILMEQHSNSGITTVAGSGDTFRSEGAQFHQPALLDSNVDLSAGSNSLTTSIPVADVISHTIASFTPPALIVTTDMLMAYDASLIARSGNERRRTIWSS